MTRRQASTQCNLVCCAGRMVGHYRLIVGTTRQFGVKSGALDTHCTADRLGACGRRMFLCIEHTCKR